MARPKAAPVNRESPFTLDELFVSSTDEKGHITFCNRTFMRVSGFAEEELLGEAHNIVRHPDMPRCVFKLLWDHLLSGRTVAAYVKNMSKDGRFYWVMAVVEPVTGGYTSVRLKPTTPLFDAARDMYTELRALERSIEGEDGKRRKEAMEASGARLLELLRGAGFRSYDAFMRAALPLEVAGRETAMGESRPAERHGRLDGDPRLARLLTDCESAHRMLASLAGQLSSYANLGEELAPRAASVLDLSTDIELFSMNARIAAVRLGNSATLGAVADILRGQSNAVGPLLSGLGSSMTGAVGMLEQMGFELSATKLQTEMMEIYVRELIEDGGSPEAAREQLSLRVESVEAAVADVCESLASLDRQLRELMQAAQLIGRDLKVIRSLEVNGRIEATRNAEGGQLKNLFLTIGRRVRMACREMEEFDRIKDLIESRDGASERLVRAQVDKMRESVAALGAAA